MVESAQRASEDTPNERARSPGRQNGTIAARAPVHGTVDQRGQRNLHQPTRTETYHDEYQQGDLNQLRGTKIPPEADLRTSLLGADRWILPACSFLHFATRRTVCRAHHGERKGRNEEGCRVDGKARPRSESSHNHAS